MPTKNRFTLILIVILMLLSVPLSSVLAGQANKPRFAPAVTKQGETTLSTNANTLLNGLSFQQNAIETYNGWQYAVWYSGTGATRHVNISRRQLPSGSWQNIEFTDYNQTVNDDHNTISMGISTQDGVIHLSFDHHDNPIRYRKSVSGLATNPASFSWTASQFGAVQSTLGGISVTPMTYPRFVRVPNGRLLFETRIGSSGDGDEYLYEYNAGTWTALGKFIEGGTGNGYLHGMNYSGNRLHVTWTWRETPTWTTNHDLMYLYSDDNGRTWKNNAGTTVTNVTQSTAGVRVWTIGQNTSLLNQEGQTVDSAGRVHVILRSNLSGLVKYEHYYRETNGTWNRRVIPVTPANLLQDRGKIVTDSNNNAYAILPNLKIASASVASNYNDWTVVYSADNGRFDREPLFDIYRMQSDGILSVFYKGLGNANLYVLNFQLNTGTVATPTPGPTTPPATWYRLTNRNSGKVADVAGQSTADGARVKQYPWNGGNNQQWEFQDAGGGYFRIVGRQSGKCLDVVSASTADGAQVDIWTCNGGTNQQFQWVATGSYFNIKARNSGKCIGIVGASTADGALLEQRTCGTGNTFQWSRQ